MDTPSPQAQAPRQCDSCDESVDVPWNCIKCETVFCLRCGRKHTIENDHRIINLSNPDQGPLLKIKRCTSHKHYDICNFCQDCDQPICAKCLVETHQGHNIQENEKVYEEKIRRLEKYHDTLSSEFLLKVSSERNELEKLKLLHNQHYEKEKQKIKDRDKLVKDLITSHTNKLLQDLDNNSKDVECKIQNLESKLENQISELEKKLRFIEESQDSIDMDTICSTNNVLKLFLEDWDTTPNSLPKENFQFVVGGTTMQNIEKIVGSLQKCYIEKMVDFEVKETYTTDLQIIGSIATSMVDNTIWIRSFKEAIVQKLELKDKKANTLLDVQKMKANDIATTPEGDLLVTLLGNSSIKKVDKSGEITDFYTYPKKMFQKAQIPIGIHVKIDGQIIVSSIEDGGDLYSVVKNSHRQLEIFSSKAEKLDILEYDSEGERLFCLPFKVTSTSNSSGDICVIDWTDSDNGRLIVLDSNGAYKWTYAGNPYNTGTRLFKPNDVVFFSNTFFLASAEEMAIHVINNKGQIIKYLRALELGFDRPCSINVDQKGQLLVGNNTGQIIVLQVYGC